MPSPGLYSLSSVATLHSLLTAATAAAVAYKLVARLGDRFVTGKTGAISSRCLPVSYAHHCSPAFPLPRSVVEPSIDRWPKLFALTEG